MNADGPGDGRLPRLSPRPLPAALTALALGIVAAPSVRLPDVALLLVAAALAVAGVALLERRRRAGALILLAAVAVFGAHRARQAAAPAPDDVSRWAGRAASLWVQGAVASDVEPTGRGGMVFTLAVRGAYAYRDGSHPAGGRLLVTFPAPRGRAAASATFPRLAPGDVVWLRGRVDAPAAATNPGGFDYAAFLARRGVFATLTARRPADVRPFGTSEAAPWTRLAGALRRAVQDATRRHLAPPDAALLDGLLLSIRGRIDADLEDAFARTGTVHVLSTSGLHLAVLAGVLQALFSVLGLPRRTAGALGIATIWLYALAAGSGPAVTRSALMITVVLAAPLVRRQPAPFASLTFAAFVILAASPLALFDAGTQLSFATVLTLVAWMPPLERWLLPWEPGQGVRQKLIRGLLLAVLVGVVAQAGSWPLVAWHYNLFSVVAPLANVPVAFLAGWLLVGGLAAVALGFVPPALTWPLWACVGFGLWLLRALTLLFAGLPLAAFSVAPPPLAFVLGYYALLWGAAPFVHAHALRKTLFAPAPARRGGGPDGALLGDAPAAAN